MIPVRIIFTAACAAFGSLKASAFVPSRGGSSCSKRGAAPEAQRTDAAESTAVAFLDLAVDDDETALDGLNIAKFVDDLERFSLEEGNRAEADDGDRVDSRPRPSAVLPWKFQGDQLLRRRMMQRRRRMHATSVSEDGASGRPSVQDDKHDGHFEAKLGLPRPSEPEAEAVRPVRSLPATVLVHSLFGSTFYWRRTAQALSQDNYFHSKKEPFSISMENYLTAIVHALDLPRKSPSTTLERPKTCSKSPSATPDRPKTCSVTSRRRNVWL